MIQLQVFDPPMCCATGVCGPQIDPALARFAADLDWLKVQGISVERFNLAQQPAAFAQNDVVKRALSEQGNDCLPLLLADGAIVSQGRYPSRAELAAFAGLAGEVAPDLFSDAVGELVAIGASIAANCQPCFRYHFKKARELGVSNEDMVRAVEIAQAVKDASARGVLELADRQLFPEDHAKGVGATPSSACCGPTAGAGSTSGSGCCQ